jgi:hypothetical protein
VSVPSSNITLLTNTDGVMELARSSVGSTGAVFSKLVAFLGAAAPVRGRREISRASQRITRLMKLRLAILADVSAPIDPLTREVSSKSVEKRTAVGYPHGEKSS